MNSVLSRMNIAGKLMTVAGLAIGALVLIGFTGVVLKTSGVVEQLSADSAVAQAESQANGLRADLDLISGTVRSMSVNIGSMHESGVRDRSLVMATLKPNTFVSDMALGSWYFAEPNGFDGQDPAMTGHPASNPKGNFVPYWIRDNGAIRMEPNTEAGLYSASYYALARDTGKAAITDPYPYETGGKTITMTSIAYPVKSDGRLIGVAGIDIALDNISERLGKLKPFGTGRVMLLSGSAMWVAHPKAEVRMKTYKEAGADQVREALSTGQTRVIEDFEVDGESMLRVIYPIRMKDLNATWALVLDVPSATIAAPATHLAWILTLGGIALLGVALWSLFQAIGAIVRRPLASLTDSVDRLSRGEDMAIPHVDREDEIGTLARAADVFRSAAADRAEADRRAAEEQRVVTGAVGAGLDALTNGDLTAEIDVAFPAGYAALKDNFNAALAGLRQMIGAVTASASGIRTGSQEIAQASEDLARRTEGNAASLEETSAALVQIDERLKASAVAASKTVARADDALATVSDGRAIAVEAVQAMDRVIESAKGIDQVIEGVDKIAFQTRVLAMNAAVEAGRAGDAGRGFAVVADLVSALAMRAEEEAKRAREQLTVTQSDIVTAVDAVQRVDGALETISGGVGEVHGLLGQMAEDNQAQSSAITQISVAVTTMDQSTQQNAAMVEQTSAAARNLTTEAVGLAQQAERFDTGDERPKARLRSVA
ncbi:methyl-accepting chemotaxis protein [Sphingomonas sp. LaA6.9]|uniref:methyl-accepting chemotaxis protein n=1 Tax=Sphingomonas sp. LaA6.9 TaxID=2919914 RepID=UPI001F4F71A9|nr:methyl-accepting chemotaxis protein [Sphingomonas sp. LaA6.9]MCJ8158644.1 methyl-accepting chemotaxis protein [Sphingomonas sp. LaA6.9]